MCAFDQRSFERGAFWGAHCFASSICNLYRTARIGRPEAMASTPLVMGPDKSDPGNGGWRG